MSGQQPEQARPQGDAGDDLPDDRWLAQISGQPAENRADEQDNGDVSHYRGDYQVVMLSEAFHRSLPFRKGTVKPFRMMT
jgi:hypothetical protein